MTLAELPHSLDYSFTAPIQTQGAFPDFLTVPDSAARLGTRRPVKVEGTIDGHPFRATLMPSGSGPHWLPLAAPLRKRLGNQQAGDQLAVQLDRRA